MDVIRMFKKYNLALAVFMETRLYKQDPRGGASKTVLPHCYWIPGPELLPCPGDADPSRDTRPRRGLGMLVDSRQLPGGTAVVELTGKHSFWAVFPTKHPGQKRLYVGATHVHVHSQPELRLAAFRELTAACRALKGKGVIVLAGDFNSRSGMNGDPVLDRSGTQFLTFARNNSLAVVNALDCCVGRYSRVQARVRTDRHGKVVSLHDETTIDYTLVHENWQHLVTKMRILDKEDLDSDHRPLLTSLTWAAATVSNSPRVKPPLKRVVKVVGASDRRAQAFEARCEPVMVNVAATVL